MSAIRSVMKGKRIYAPELMEDMYSEANPLTDREKEVLELVADGKNTKEIAQELSIKSGTVRNYISMILEKLEVKIGSKPLPVQRKKAGLNKRESWHISKIPSTNQPLPRRKRSFSTRTSSSQARGCAL